MSSCFIFLCVLGTEYPPPQELPETPVFQPGAGQPEQVASEEPSSQPEPTHETSAEPTQQQAGSEYQTGDAPDLATSSDQQAQSTGLCHNCCKNFVEPYLGQNVK